MALGDALEVLRRELEKAARGENTTMEEAIHWLQNQSDSTQGPLLAMRLPSHQTKVNLKLRHCSMMDALHSLAIIGDLEVSWHSWGVGLAPKTTLAASGEVKRGS